MERLRIAWQTFWARRSRGRIALMCVLLALTVSAIVWLALPADWQQQAQSGVASAAQWVGSLDMRTMLVALIGLCVVEALVLLFVPSYRKQPYLATTPALIPKITVYLDAENQHPERAIMPFMRFLRTQLNGARADLLFFQSATKGATKPAYRTLRLSGFQPVDVPHDPTGKNEIDEAVDREIAMHAFERALFGPENQLFVIISQDGGYVPLVYRLLALEHRVEIWASDPPKAYAEVQKFVNVVPNDPAVGDGNVKEKLKLLRLVVVDLTEKIPELRQRQGRKVKPSIQQKPTLSEVPSGNEHVRQPSQREMVASGYQAKTVLGIPPTISLPGEEEIYRAIMCTIEVRDYALSVGGAGENGNSFFHTELGTQLKPFLIRLGYSDGNRTNLKYWLIHLHAIHLFGMAAADSLPEHDDTPPDQAARSMFAMARLAADAAVRAASMSKAKFISMHKIVNAISSMQFSEGELALPLIGLLMSDGPHAGTRMRFFIQSARALSLLSFDDDPGTQDRIRNPRLPITPTGDPSSQVNSTTLEPTDPHVPDAIVESEQAIK